MVPKKRLLLSNMKILLVDADGVILKKGEYFSEKFAREHNVPLEKVVEFFKGPFGLCQKGTADLKEELAPYLTSWNWDKGIEAFLDYWFNYDVEFNSNVELTLARFRDQGVKCYLASNNEKYRANFIRSKIDAKKLLDGYYFSYEIKHKKSEPAFFEFVLGDLQVEPEEVYFIDNDESNIAAALSLGIKAYLYNNGLLDELLTKV